MGRRRRRTDEAPEVEPDEVEPDEVEPLDVDGVRTVAVLTVLWAVAFVVLALRVDTLEAEGRGWWLWTCLAGVGLGLLGLEYTRKRRDAINDAEAEPEAAEVEPETAEQVAEPPTSVQPRPVAPAASDTTARVDNTDGAGHPADQGGAPMRQRRGSQPDAVTRPIDTGTGTDLPPVSSTGPQPVARVEQPPVSSTGPQPVARVEQPPVSSTGPQPVTRPGPQRPATPSSAASAERPTAPGRARPPRRGAESELFGDLGAGAAPGQPAASPPGDDEPLLDTTLSGRRARDYDMAEEVDEITEGGGTQYRGRRARRSDTA